MKVIIWKMPRLLRIEDQVLLICAHQDFTKEYIHALQNIIEIEVDWNLVLQTALKNHIGPLVFGNLQKANIVLPPTVELNFKKDYIDNILRKKEAHRLLTRTLASISEWQKQFSLEVRLMLVKGAAYNILIYSKPWYTRSADIDLLFDLPAACIPEEARTHLVNSLEMLNAMDNTFRTHLEYDFYMHHDITIDGLLPLDPERIWRDASPIQIDGKNLFVMSPEDNLIVAAIACCRRRYYYLKPLLLEWFC